MLSRPPTVPSYFGINSSFAWLWDDSWHNYFRHRRPERVYHYFRQSVVCRCACAVSKEGYPCWEAKLVIQCARESVPLARGLEVPAKIVAMRKTSVVRCCFHPTPVPTRFNFTRPPTVSYPSSETENGVVPTVLKCITDETDLHCLRLHARVYTSMGGGDGAGQCCSVQNQHTCNST